MTIVDNKATLIVEDVSGHAPMGECGKQAHLNFRLRAGEVVGFPDDQEGRRLFRLIMGQGSLHTGSIRLFDEFHRDEHVDYGDQRIVLRRVGFAFRDKGLISNKTLFDNVDLPPRYHGYYESREDEGCLAREALAKLGVDEKYWAIRPPSLNWEIRKRALLARATVLKPRLLLLDDPTALLGSSLYPELVRWIRSQAREGVSFIVASENIPFLLACSDRIVNPTTNAPQSDATEFIDLPWIQSAEILRRLAEVA